MTVYDSSVLIDYLDGVDSAVHYVESHLDEHAVAPQLVLFELYQGEVFKQGPADFDALDGALGWVTFLDGNEQVARAAADLQNELHRRGNPLAARDAFIAGTAMVRNDRLVVSDSDFDVPGVTEFLDIDILH